MTASSGYVVALDVGGSAMKAGLVDEAGRLTAEEERTTEIERGPEAVVERVRDFAGELVESASAAGCDVRGVALAVPGFVDEGAGLGLLSVNLGWRNVPFAALLTERTGRPVTLSHDVRAAGLAEQVLGAGRGATDLLFVALGTGIAAALIVSDEAVAGAHRTGGELGHTVVDPAGPVCGCGRRGHLEAVASASGIERRYRALTGSDETVGPDRVVERLGKDPVADRVWDEAIETLGLSLANYVMLLDPERIVIGGGVANAADALFTPLRRRVAAHLLDGQTMPDILPGDLGVNAGCLGAGLRAWLDLGVDKAELLRSTKQAWVKETEAASRRG